jgi:hypothetical protein
MHRLLAARENGPAIRLMLLLQPARVLFEHLEIRFKDVERSFRVSRIRA